MNSNELRSVMAKHGDNGQKLAEALGRSPQAVSCKLNSKRKFTLEEIQVMIKRYDLAPEDVQLIFFTS